MYRFVICWFIVTLMPSSGLTTSGDGAEGSRSGFRLTRPDLTILGATIGSSEKSDILHQLGPAPVFRASQTQGSDDLVCYRAAQEGDDTVVAFHFGPLGGWIDLTEISISRATELSWSVKKCGHSEQISRNLQFLRGLHLGASPEDVARSLGPGRSLKGNRLKYYGSHHCPQQTAAKPQGNGTRGDADVCEIVDSVEIKFTDGRMSFASFYEFVDR